MSYAISAGCVGGPVGCSFASEETGEDLDRKSSLNLVAPVDTKSAMSYAGLARTPWTKSNLGLLTFLIHEVYLKRTSLILPHALLAIPLTEYVQLYVSKPNTVLGAAT